MIKAFGWDDWADLWATRFAQLQEHGIVLSDLTPPDRCSAVSVHEQEYDFHHIQQVYLSGKGNFWLARSLDQPIGYVGAQDIGDAIELRRMYVQASHRRRGVGTALVSTLLTYCTDQDAPAIELWTQSGGAGMHLYCTLGFRRVTGPGPEFSDVGTRTRYKPGADEIRMRFDLRRSKPSSGFSPV